MVLLAMALLAVPACGLDRAAEHSSQAPPTTSPSSPLTDAPAVTDPTAPGTSVAPQPAGWPDPCALPPPHWLADNGFTGGTAPERRQFPGMSMCLFEHLTYHPAVGPAVPGSSVSVYTGAPGIDWIRTGTFDGPNAFDSTATGEGYAKGNGWLWTKVMADVPGTFMLATNTPALRAIEIKMVTDLVPYLPKN